MWFSYAPEVKAVIRFIELLKVRVTRSTISETLQAHPDWPSLLCISDSLKQWHIPNAAAKIDNADLNQLPVPFIAYLPGQPVPITVVTEIADNTITTYNDNFTRRVALPKEKFLSLWTGIYLLAEPTVKSGEKNYLQKKKRAFVASLTPVLLLILIIGCCIFWLDKNLQLINLTQQAGVWFQYGVVLTGVAVCILLLWYEMDQNNPLLNKVCTGVARGNCSAILTGKASRLFSWLSWSEVGFFFFAGSLFLIVLTPYNPVPYALNLVALPYIFFSVYYQWQVAKQWCVLCLAVQVLLLAGAVNVMIHFLPLLGLFTTKNILQSFAAYLLMPLLWYSIKPLFLNLQGLKGDKRQYLRMKFNTEVFETLLVRQKKITAPTADLGIVIGNPHAQHEIVKVCNPYCGPCAASHPKLEKLVQEYPNIKARIIFNATTEEKDFRKDVVAHLLAVEAGRDAEKTKAALDTWYGMPQKKLSILAAAYPVNGLAEAQHEKIVAMDTWCRKVGIEYTPTFFINGNQLPGAYSLGDIGYFLAE